MKQVAWNGIRFKAPRPWQIGRIGTRHLVLEDAGGPAMEVKWGPEKAKFSHAAHLKRLAASRSRKDRSHFAEWFLLPPWEKALVEFETR